MITSRSHSSVSSCAAAAALALTVSPLCLRAEGAPPPGFVSLWSGKDLSGWYGWGTTDPRTFLALTPEQQAEYRKQSIHRGRPARDQ